MLLKSELRKDPSLGKLQSRLERRFHPAEVSLVKAEDVHSMFVDITGPSDRNRYFLRIDLGSEGIARFMHRQMANFVWSTTCSSCPTAVSGW